MCWDEVKEEVMGVKVRRKLNKSSTETDKAQCDKYKRIRHKQE